MTSSAIAELETPSRVACNDLWLGTFSLSRKLISATIALVNIFELGMRNCDHISTATPLAIDA
jgi:hypothetical protein